MEKTLMKCHAYQLGCVQQEGVLSVLSHTSVGIYCVACHVATFTTCTASGCGSAKTVVMTVQSAAGQRTNPNTVCLTLTESNLHITLVFLSWFHHGCKATFKILVSLIL